MNKNIISLTGLSGVGKSTIAEILQEEKGYKIVSWCSQLRRRVALKCDLDMPAQYLDTPENYGCAEIVPDKEWEHKSGFHQLLLDEPIETKLEAFAVTCLVILTFAKANCKVVIPDTRFPREYEFLKDLNATKTFIHSSWKQRKKQPFDELLRRRSFDAFINNSSDIGNLKETVLKYLNQLIDS
jgi:hypothetical protein